MIRLPPTLRRIVLHVGPSKTGTTTLQRTLAEHRGTLRAHGICYPDTIPASREGQHGLAWDIRRASGQAVRDPGNACLSWAQALAAARADRADTLLISSEEFSDFDAPAMIRLRECLDEIPLEIVFALRDPAAVIASAWRQGVKWGFGMGEECLDLDEAARLLATADRIAVVPYLERARALLRPTRIGLFTVPARPDPALLIRRFVAAAALPRALGGLAWSASGVENRSYSLHRTRLLLAINRAMEAAGKSGTRALTRGLELRPAILDAIERLADPDPAAQPAVPPAIVGALREPLLRWLGGQEVHGTLADLAAAPAVAADAKAEPPAASLDRAALIALCTALAGAQAQIAALEAGRRRLKQVYRGLRDAMPRGLAGRIDRRLRAFAIGADAAWGKRARILAAIASWRRRPAAAR